MSGTHEGPKLHPLHVPALAVLADSDAWDFLAYQDPIDDPGMLAFQVAAMTIGMGELKRRIEALELKDAGE